MGPLLEPTGFRPDRFGRCTAATTFKLEACASGFYSQTSLSGRLVRIGWRRKRQRKKPLIESQSTVSTRSMTSRELGATARTRSLLSAPRLCSKPTIRIQSLFPPLRVVEMANNQLAAADLVDLRRTASCPNARGPNWHESRGWPPSARPTVVSLRRHLHRRRPPRPRLGRLLRNSQLPNLHPHPRRLRSGNTRRGRRVKATEMFLFLPPKVASFLRSSGQRNTSSLRRSKSASHLGHLLRTILLNRHIHRRIWPSRRTTMLCSFLTLSRRLGLR